MKKENRESYIQYRNHILDRIQELEKQEAMSPLSLDETNELRMCREDLRKANLFLNNALEVV